MYRQFQKKQEEITDRQSIVKFLTSKKERSKDKLKKTNCADRQIEIVKNLTRVNCIFSMSC